MNPRSSLRRYLLGHIQNINLAIMLSVLLILGMVVASCGKTMTPKPSLASQPSLAPTRTATSPLPAVTPTLPGMLVVDPGQPLPPQVIGQQPGIGQELAPDGSIQVDFDQPMDQVKTSGAVEVSDSQGSRVEGKISWITSSSIRFVPQKALNPGSTYTVQLTTGVTSQAGVAILEPVRWEINTVGDLQVVQVFPANGSADVESGSVITVIFNHPVVPLVIAEEQKDLPEPLIISPTVAGTGEWVNTSVYAFRPATTFHGRTTYQITVKGGLKDALGESKLVEDYRWEFTTIAPSIGSYWMTKQEWNQNPGNDYPNVLLGQAFAVSFYQPMDKGSVEANLSIQSEKGEPALLAYTWNDDLTQVVFTPTQRLAYDTQYTLSINRAAQAADGGTLKDGLQWTFHTIPYPGIVSTTPQNDTIMSRFNSQFVIQFASPMDLNSFKDKVVFNPALENMSETWNQGWWYDEWNLTLSISGLKPSISYTIHILPGMTDIYGTMIEKETIVSFKNGAYDPSAYLQMPVSPVLYRVGGPQEFYASYVNISQVSFELYRLSLDEFVNLQNGTLSQWTYKPTGDSLVAKHAEASTDTLNQRTLKNFQLNMGAEQLTPGFYFLGMISPQVPRGEAPFNDSRLLIVSTANVTFKNTPTQTLVWLTDLASGKPLPGVGITIYDTDLKAITQGVTDQDGVLYVKDLPLPAEDNPGYTYYARYAMTQEGGSVFAFASNSMDSDVSLYNYGIWSDYYTPPKQPTAYVYTERPIYRPGQPVYFKGILRINDDLDYSLPDLKEVEVRIDSYQEQVYQQKLKLSDYGTFDGELLLDTNGALGAYTLNVYLTGSDFSIGSVTFTVAEYRKPEFKVDVKAQPGNLLPGGQFNVDIQATYYSGGNVANADVSWSLLADAFTFTPPPDLSGYSFTDYESDLGYYNYDYFGTPGSEVIAQGTGKTDAQGKLSLSLPAELGKTANDRKLTIEATINDIAGTAVTGRDAVVVHRSFVYPGIRTQTYVGTGGQEQTFELVAVDWDGNLLPGQSTRVDIVERRWYSVQEQDAQGRIVWKSSVEDVPVQSFEDVVMNEQGKANVSFTPAKGGVYRAVVTAQDSNGNEGKASAYLWVAGEDYVPWRQGNDHGFELIADKTSYQVGETADILIASPFQGEAYGLVTVERGLIRSHEVINLVNNSTIYHLPITGDIAPNVYIFVTIIMGVNDTNPRPDFRIGLAQLKVDPGERAIQIKLTPDNTQVGPGEQVDYQILTTDAHGEPISAELSLSLSDLATLSLMPPNSPPILDYFYASRSLSVWTAMPLVYSVEYYNFILAQQTEQGAPVGSGGGKGEGEPGVIEVRQEFPDTAYWTAHLVTDANGQAQVTVTLPDNLTTWRMEAKAVTEDTLVGQASVDIVSSKPLLVRPQTPRFFVAGDEVVVGTAVHNNTDTSLPVVVTLNGEGISLEDQASRDVNIEAGAQVYVTWKVKVMEEVERVDLVFSAISGQYSDASRPTLGSLDGQGIPVYRYEAPEVVATSGQLLAGGTQVEAISLPKNLKVRQGELLIKVSPSLAAGMTDGLKYLEDYPYECIEQTISRFLPNVITIQALKAAGVSDPELQANLDTQVNTALQSLYSWQNPDGGWGWWNGEKSDPLTSAYVVLGLVEAKNAGYEVSVNVLHDGVYYLQTQVTPATRQTSTWKLNQQAFILYVLARSGNPNVSKTVQLYDFRQALAIYARAFLTKTLYWIDPQDPRIDTLLSDINNSAILSATGTHWEESENDYWNWNTNTRTTAIVLSVLSEIDKTNPLNANAVRWLMSSRTNGHWLSTQETAWTIMALTGWMTQSGELNPDYEYAVGLNGEKLGGGTADAGTLRQDYELRVSIADLLTDQANRLAIARSNGPGNLYYTAHLSVNLPVEQIETLDRGIVVSRSYFQVGDLKTPVTQASQGDLLMVQVTIIAPHDLQYVVIDDPLPAGLEAVDQNLLTSPQAVQPESYAYNDLVTQGWGWWYFSHVEMRDEKLVLSTGYLPAGTYIYTYLVRASTPGVFRVIPTTAQEFYFPEVYGRGAGSLFEVNP